MKLKKSATALIALMALATANTAFAAVICNEPVDQGSGEVFMTVSISNTLAEAADITTTGPVVSVDAPLCILGANTCSVTAQGTPGGGAQLVSVSFLEQGASSPVVCEIDNADGLPVELNKFSVE